MKLFRRRPPEPTVLCQLCRQTEMTSCRRVGDRLIPAGFCQECFGRLRRGEIKADDGVVDDIAQELDVDDLLVPDNAITKLMWLGRQRAVPPLGAHLVKSPSMKAMRAMAYFGNPQSLPYLHDTLSRHGSWWGQHTYQTNDAELLGQVVLESRTRNDFEDVEPVLRELGKKLGEGEDAFLIQTLLRIVEDPEALRRRDASDCLARFLALRPRLREHPQCRKLVDDGVARLRQGDAAEQGMSERVQKAFFMN
jgi:hypothetical protein